MIRNIVLKIQSVLLSKQGMAHTYIKITLNCHFSTNSKFGNSDSNRMKTEQLKNDEFGKRKNGAGGVAIRLASDRGQTVDDTTVPQVDLFVTPTLFERYSPEKINNQSRLSVLDFFNASTAVWLPTSRIERKRTILYISVGAWYRRFL